MAGKKQRSVKKSSAQVRRDLNIFEKGIVRLKELEKELGDLDTRGFYREEQNIRAKLKNVSDIPLIEGEIKTLRLKIGRKYRPKRKKLKSKVVERLEDLSKKIDLMKRIPRKVVDVDSGVGVLVDADFNGFLSDIKSKLSERVREKEKELDDVLGSDLAKRELNFKRKYESLFKEFNVKRRKLAEAYEKRYQTRLGSELHREISDRFDRELKAKLDSEKVALGKKYRESLRLHAHEHLRKEEDALKAKLSRQLSGEIVSLESGFEKKRKKLEDRMNKMYSAKMKAVEKERRAIEAKMEMIDLREQRWIKKASMEVDAEKSKLKMEIGVERVKLGEGVDAKRMVLESKRKKLEDRMKSNALENKRVCDVLAKGKWDLERAKKDFSVKKVDEIQRVKNSLAIKFHDSLAVELARKEKGMREELKNEYGLLLKKKIDEYEADLKKRKINLELEIQRRMREALR